jgi:hypothetical protein
MTLRCLIFYVFSLFTGIHPALSQSKFFRKALGRAGKTFLHATGIVQGVQDCTLIYASTEVNDLVLPDGSAGGTEVILKLPVRHD